MSFKWRNFRNAKSNIHFTGESWMNARVTVSKEWEDVTIRTPKQLLLFCGLSCRLKSHGRGPRFALVHAGNE
jgi:hypothetical protein